MARALELAARGLYTTDPNPRVGCVLVRGGEMLGEGWHERAGEAHAEVAALARGARRCAGRDGLCDARALQPHRPHAALRRCIDRRRHSAAWCAPRSIPIRGWPAPASSVCGPPASRCRWGCSRPRRAPSTPGSFRASSAAGPYVRLKLAMSLDARTAPAGGGADVDQRRGLARRRAALAGAQLRRAHRRRHGAHRRSAARRALGLRSVGAAAAAGAARPGARLLARRAGFSRARARWYSPPRRRRAAAAARLAGARAARRRGARARERSPSWISRRSSRD